MLELDLAKEQMAEERERLAELDIARLLDEPKELPALPMIATRVMQITSDPKATLPELRRVIETDEALASKLLRFSNSALYGRVGTISTLTAAITALGFLTVRWLAVTASAHTLFRGTAKQDSDHFALWEHAIRCAIGSQLLAKRLAQDIAAEEAFVAGLLHDIGKLAILEIIPGYISRFYKWGEALSLEFFRVEMDVIGIDHSEVSGHIFKHWNFPSSLSDAVANHHSPESAKHSKPLAQVLFTMDKFFPLSCCWDDPLSSEELMMLPLMRERNIGEQDIADLRERTEELYFELSDVLGA